jgi:hypothetical protein
MTRVSCGNASGDDAVGVGEYGRGNELMKASATLNKKTRSSQ